MEVIGNSQITWITRLGHDANFRLIVFVLMKARHFLCELHAGAHLGRSRKGSEEGCNNSSVG
jgi:hypothetical protein